MAKKCCEEVFDSLTWRNHPCNNKGKVERDGKWYCGTHDPVAKKERAAKRGPTEWEREMQRRQDQRDRIAALEAENAELKLRLKEYADTTAEHHKSEKAAWAENAELRTQIESERKEYRDAANEGARRSQEEIKDVRAENERLRKALDNWAYLQTKLEAAHTASEEGE